MPTERRIVRRLLLTLAVMTAAVRLKNLQSWFLQLIALTTLCSILSADSTAIIKTADLPIAQELRASGKKLINQKYGFTRIDDDSSYDVRTVVVTVHGLKSEGYEWVYGVRKLAQQFRHTYFYRYNWEVCPDSASMFLAKQLSKLIGDSPGCERLIIFGHSYGGIVVTELASRLYLNIPVEIHTIASPLRGYAALSKRCEPEIQRDGTLMFSEWETNISHFQWRTQHKLDGAFRRLKIDPQDILITGSEVTLLPDSMNGRRLGHNWSITWVVDEFLRIPHKP